MELSGSILEETEKQTIYDVVRNKLRYTKRRAFLHRVMYIGKHESLSEDGAELKQCFEKNIRHINGGHVDEQLSGFLLVYPTHFMHTIEASEDTIVKHLRLLLSDIKAQKVSIPEMKVLAVHHHIKERFFPQWASKSAKLAESGEIDRSLGPEHCVKDAVIKLWHIGEYLKEQTMASYRAALDYMAKRLSGDLPDYSLLDYLLKLDSLLNVEEYVGLYGLGTPLVNARDAVWPCDHDFIPYNVWKEEEIEDEEEGENE